MKVKGSVIASDSQENHLVQAAEIQGIRDRHMRRWREEYSCERLVRSARPAQPEAGPHPNRGANAGAYREEYFDFTVRHFREKLVAEHDIGLSYAWSAQLVERGRHFCALYSDRGSRLPILYFDPSTLACLCLCAKAQELAHPTAGERPIQN